MSDHSSDPKSWWDGDYVWRPDEASPTGSPEPPEPVPEEPLELPAPVPCWRCGKDVKAEAATCPYCCARLHSDAWAAELRPARPMRSIRLEEEGSPLFPLLWFYGGLLLVSLIQGLLIFSAARNGALD